MSAGPVRGRRWANHRGTHKGVALKCRANSPRRDLSEEFGSLQTARRRLIRWAVDDTWEKISGAVLAAADAVDGIGWTVGRLWEAVVVRGAVPERQIFGAMR